jgi:hypothetical protein
MHLHFTIIMHPIHRCHHLFYIYTACFRRFPRYAKKQLIPTSKLYAKLAFMLVSDNFWKNP